MTDQPRRTWDDLTCRLQQFANRPGLAILTLRVVVCDGRPVAWTEPTETRLEPKADGRALLDLLSEGQGA